MTSSPRSLASQHNLNGPLNDSSRNGSGGSHASAYIAVSLVTPPHYNKTRNSTGSANSSSNVNVSDSQPLEQQLLEAAGMVVTPQPWNHARHLDKIQVIFN